LVEVVLAMGDLHAKPVAIEGDRCIKVRHCDTNMIKTK